MPEEFTQPWALALRPETLADELLAPTFNLDALRKTWAQPARPHVFGLFGPPGCGKTTTARALAEELRQEFAREQDNPDAPIQLHEVNVADDNGVAFARALAEKMMLRSPRPVVWILDEVHQLTTEAQNVLLKTLEEPPRFAYFFLATTDAQKLKPAVLSRCHTVQFVPLSRPAWMMWAKAVCTKLGYPIPVPPTLDAMWELAQGSPRKLLQVLQSFCITGQLQDAVDIEGEASVPAVAKLLLNHGKWSALQAMLKEGTWDPERLRRGVMGYLSAIMLNCTTPADLSRAKRALTPFVRGPQFYDRASFLIACCEAWEASAQVT